MRIPKNYLEFRAVFRSENNREPMPSECFAAGMKARSEIERTTSLNPDMTPEEISLLTKIAQDNPEKLEFLMKLLNSQPCVKCDHIKRHCRCP